MTWELRYAEGALKQLDKMDPHQRALILSWMAKHVDGCEDPRSFGKGLRGDLSGRWRYRIGDYRVLCDIHDDALIVLAISVGHRSRVYRRRG